MSPQSVYHGPSPWPLRLRWLGVAVCALRGHKKAIARSMVDGLAVAVYCGRCREFLYTASTHASTWQEKP